MNSRKNIKTCYLLAGQHYSIKVYRLYSSIDVKFQICEIFILFLKENFRMSNDRMKKYHEKLQLAGNENLLEVKKEKDRAASAKYRLKKKNDPEFRKKKAEGKKRRRLEIKEANQKASVSGEDGFKS